MSEIFKENLRKNNYHWRVEDVNSIKILFVKNDFITGGLRILAKSLAFINLHFTVTIAGPDLKFEEEIKSYFQSPNIELNFIGRQSQKQVFNHMATQHIFCVPSLQEALGVANLEALNIGIPVVSTDAGGIPEALGYGSCGFLCKVADAVSLSDALQACIYNFEERNRKVLNGFKHVKKFKAEFIINNLNSILNERV